MLKNATTRHRGFRRALLFEQLEDRCLLANSFLQGVAFHDVNQNDQLDPADMRLANSLIQLFRGNDQDPIAQTLSDNDGYYYFGDVAPGNYRLVQTPPLGFTSRSAQANSQINPASIPPATQNTILVTVLDPVLLSSEYQDLYVSRQLPQNAVRLFGQIPSGFQQPADVGQLRVRINRPGLPAVDIRTFCSELAVALEFPNGPFTPIPNYNSVSERPLQIGYLFNRYGVRTDLTPDQAAGLQLAIWEMIYDTVSNDPWNTGNFRYEITTPAVLAEANFFMNDAVGRTGHAVQNVSSDPFYQSFLSTLSLNFGSVRTGAIVGWKWHDQNRSRTWNPGEPGLGNWTIFLDRNNNAQLDPGEVSTQTGANGQYRFDELAPGSYRVCEVISGLSENTYPGNPPCHTVTVAAGQTVTGRFETTEPPNFGNRFFTLIDAWKWHDRNGNAQWDQGEPGLAGWTIQAVQNGQVVASTVTMADDPTTPENETGYYCFIDLAPGTYILREVVQPGWRQTYPPNNGTHTVTLVPGGMVVGEFGRAMPPNFGNQQLSSIIGWKWNDLDRDRTWDRGEPGLGDWTIFLDQNNNAMLDPNEPRTQTGANGQYQFPNLVPGTYRVCEVILGLYESTYPGNPPCHTVTLSPGQTVAGRFETTEPPNFGNRSFTLIDAWKWNDRNGNAEWDAGERGLSGWTIQAVRNGQVVASTITATDDPATPGDETGYWCFIDLAPGIYLFREVLQPDWQQTYPENGEGHTVELRPGELFYGEFGRAMPPNFGNQQLSLMTGWQWDDRNNDGRWDRGEPGLGNVTIFLDRDYDGILDAGERSTTTAANGSYRFPSLRSGTHEVCSVAPNGWAHTYPNTALCHTVTVAAGQTLAGRFETTEALNGGIRALPAWVHGWMWNDLNGDGRWDANEDALPYWTIELVQNGAVVARGYTTEDDPSTPAVNERGEYWIQAPAGNYTLRVVAQEHWGQTFPASGHAITLTPGQFLDGRRGVTQAPSFSAQELVPVAGWKWHDRNGNGEWDEGEPGLAGWSIELLRNNVVVGRTVTMQDDPRTPYNETGMYWLEMFPGAYQVREMPQAGWNLTYPNGNGRHAFALTPGQYLASYFGFTAMPSFAGCRPSTDGCTSGPGAPGGGAGLVLWQLENAERADPVLPQLQPSSGAFDSTLAQVLAEESQRRAAPVVAPSVVPILRANTRAADEVFTSQDWLFV